MKKKLFFVLTVFCVFNLGCTRLIVKKSSVPYEIISKPTSKEIIKGEIPFETEKKEFPPEKKTEIIERKIEVVSEIPEGNYQMLKIGADPERDPKTITIGFVEEEMRKKDKWGLFLTEKPIVVETKGKSGKWYRGYIPPKTILLGEVNEEKEKIEFLPKKIAFCWNEIRGIKFLIYPQIIKSEEKVKEIIIERYRDIEKINQVIIERYRDIDYTPAIWSGVGGVAIGWFLKPAQEAVKVVPPTVVTR